MEVYVACFDISDDGLRARVGKVLLRYGDRVQKSVFEIAVRDHGELETIRQELVEIVADDDNIRFYRLCGTCRSASSTLDGQKVAHFPAVLIV
ncbi:MAG: CRISPR-associated endonuclease Cas2 [Chromatiaceae bacterium]|jgi:CRISPR-associated protein Cas2|nr:CRISPR-associated endonuclease Cas2 [Chromatiaceae bacterium]